MISDLLKKNLIEFVDAEMTWQDAIYRSGQSLLNAQYISSTYLDEIISCIEEHGPYIVILPEIAMPHASVGSLGVLKTGISLTIFQSLIDFEADKSARVFFTLATNDAQEHLSNIQKLMDFLMDDTKRTRLLGAQSLEDLRGL